MTKAHNSVSANDWYTYLVRCRDGSLYCGVAKDLEMRVDQHNNDNRLGAKYTKPRRPVKLVYFEETDSRSSACRREYQIKQLSRKAKLTLISTNS